MLTALLFGLAASSALVAGGAAGAFWRPPRPLASLADTLMPDAYREGGGLVAFATAAGFFVSYMIENACAHALLRASGHSGA